MKKREKRPLRPLVPDELRAVIGGGGADPWPDPPASSFGDAKPWPDPPPANVFDTANPWPDPPHAS